MAAFYSPLTRFWELFVGAAIAYAGTRNVVPNLTLANTFSIVGSALVLTGLMFVSKDSAFPGWWAILPTIGAALIIAGASGKKRPWINILLSNKVFVWFGLISYPLYLWHWPLLAFARILEGQEPSRLIRVSAVLASIILAWLTYIFVEKPIRFGHGIGGRGRRNVVYALAVLMTIVACFGIATFWYDGFLNRTASNPKLLNSGQLTHEETQAYMEKNFYLCTPEHIRIKAIFGKSPIQCYQSKQGRPIDIALIGDSHSQHLFIGLAEALKDKNVVFYMKDAPPSIRNAEFNDIFGSVIFQISYRDNFVLVSQKSHFQIF